jgi:hypothetical protein
MDRPSNMHEGSERTDFPPYACTEVHSQSLGLSKIMNAEEHHLKPWNNEE